MSQILLMLLEHPLTTGFLVLCGLGFIRMTYDFILRLFGRKGLDGLLSGTGGEGTVGDAPPEPSKVSNPDGPDDIVEAEEEIPEEDGEE